MARFCKQCNRKFGFFEEDFDGICIECYEKNQEEERIRIIEQERKRKKELEAQRIAYEQKILEEKKLEEQKRSEEQKRLEEQKRIKENEERLRKKEEELQLRIQKRLEKEELRKKRQQEYIEKMQLKRQMEIEKQEEKKKKEKIKIQEIKKQKELKKEKIQKELELEKEKINTYLDIIFNNPVILSIYNEIIIDLTEYSKNNVSEKIVYILATRMWNRLRISTVTLFCRIPPAGGVQVSTPIIKSLPPHPTGRERFLCVHQALPERV